MADGMRIIGSSRRDGSSGKGIMRAPQGRRRPAPADDRAEEAPPPPDGALAETRARIAAAMSDVGQLQAMLEAAMDQGAEDPGAIAAAHALAARISTNRGDSIAAQAWIEAETVKLVIER